MMAVNLRKIEGNWHLGYALDKHMLSSTFTGHNEYGHPTFDNKRTDVGEAVYQLKYRQDWAQAARLARGIVTHIVPLLADKIGLVVPMPASTVRARQPVTEVAQEVAKLLQVNVFTNLLIKNNVPNANQSLKNLGSKEEKVAALAGRFRLEDVIAGKEQWNALVIDDLFDSGASMEAACSLLKSYEKIDKVFVAALTWK